MRPREPFPDHLRALALRHDGVLVRGQLVTAGLADSQIARMTDQGQLLRLDVGVYLLGQTPPHWSQWAWAGVLVGGRGARLMRRSAGAVLGLVPAVLPIEVAVTSKRADRSWVAFARQSSPARSSSSTGSPPRTLTPDTVLDLCAVSDVERAHGLPRPDRNRRLASGRHPDVRYDDYRVLIELDGQAYHRESFRDWRRDNVHGEDGWLTLRYGWRDVIGQPCATAGNAARVLQNRGWTGELVACSPLCGRSLP